MMQEREVQDSPTDGINSAAPSKGESQNNRSIGFSREIVIALISVVSTLAAVIVAGAFSAIVGERQIAGQGDVAVQSFLRDRRQASYSKLLKDADSLFDAESSLMNAATPSTPARSRKDTIEKSYSMMSAKLADLRSDGDEIVIVGSPDVVQAVRKMIDTAYEYYNLAELRIVAIAPELPTQPDTFRVFSEKDRDLSRYRLVFIQAARAELENSPLPQD